MTIKLKLLFGGLTVSILIAAVLALTLYSFASLSDGFVDIVDKAATGVSNSQSTEASITRADADLGRISQEMLNVAQEINRTNQTVRIVERKTKQLSEALDELMQGTEEVAQELPDGSARYNLEDLSDTAGDIRESVRREALVSLSATVKKMREFTEQIGAQVEGIEKLSGELAKSSELSKGVVTANKEIRRLSERFEQEIGISRNVIAAVLIAIVIATLISAVFLTRSITRPLNRTIEVAKGIADGKLGQKIDFKGKDEVCQLGTSMAVMIRNLTNVIGEIKDAADTVQAGSNEIARSNMDLSQRTEEQASGLEETASIMDEMLSSVKQNADNALQANDLGSRARAQAESGGEVVGKTVSAMQDINTVSKKIADIIGVIDEIAFQTNLLALNAAVEAARAGEQGRGFAVVAGEVRTLAQRSAVAAKEIKDLIKDSGEKVDEGSRLVNESGQALADIVSAVKKVSDFVAEIAAACQEQTTGIGEVNKAVVQMEEMTHQNAALVEEAAAASEAMGEQAQNLNELMKFFQVGEAQAALTSRHADRPQTEERPSEEQRSATVGPRAAKPDTPADQNADSATRANAKSPPDGVADGDWEEF